MAEIGVLNPLGFGPQKSMTLTAPIAERSR